MAYLDIDNLYKSRDILLFKAVYAMEKIHGTSAHIGWKDRKLSFFSGGVDHKNFIALFDEFILAEKFISMGLEQCVVFGEAYGGKCQGMKETYGSNLKFIGFEVKIEDSWLNVPSAEKIVLDLGLEFVDYRLIPCSLEAIDAERDRESIQAIRNGCGPGKNREGIVLRPPIELHKNNGERIIAKHKREDFRETKTPRPLNEEKLRVLTEAQAIADEWTTEMRLTHILDKFPGAGIEQTGNIIRAMLDDIQREAKGEIVDSKEARKAIGKRASEILKKRFSKIS